MTAECWRWRPRWNRLASSTSRLGSSARPQPHLNNNTQQLEILLDPRGAENDDASAKPPNLPQALCDLDLWPFDLLHPSCCGTMDVYRNMCLSGLITYNLSDSSSRRSFCDIFQPRLTLPFDLLTSQSIISCRFIHFQIIAFTSLETDGQTNERTQCQPSTIPSPLSGTAVGTTFFKILREKDKMY